MNQAHKPKSPQMGIDAWMFVVMFAGYAITFHGTPPVVAILFAMLLLYLSADGLLPARWGYHIKFFLLALAVSLFAVGFTITQIILRHNTAPYLYVHDGLIQTEEATRFLLAGKNPYVEDYTQTPMKDWDFRVGNLRLNPALYHNAYLPFLFLFSAPFYVIINTWLGWFDGRMVFLPMFIGVLAMLARWVSERGRKFALLLFVTLNPFFAPYLVQGRNDVFVLFWIVLSVHLLRQHHEAWSLVAMGLACTSKLTAWFLIPFYTLYLVQPSPDALWLWLRTNVWSVQRRLLPLIGTFALIMVPFLVWQPVAFVDGIWNFMNGTSAFAPYPIFGYGFNILAQGFGLLPADALRSPFEILQWIIGLPLLVLLVWRQIKNNTLPQMWFSYALLLAVMSFFSHVLNDNHIGFILTLFAIAFFSDDPNAQTRAALTEKNADALRLDR